MPKHFKPADIERFVAAKEKWIQAKVAHFAARAEMRDKHRAKFAGELSDEAQRILFQKTPKVATAHYATYKEQARALITERLAKFGAFYKTQGYALEYMKITIRNQKTRWGSCSRHKKRQKDGTVQVEYNLNFNWRLALIPARMADYIIVHELVHVGELNHGPAFWKLVALAVPDFAEVRADLRKMGVVLG